mmetsp:Transcript_85342/g.204452  ORF Transcript_85342/g.204452 Transcript_85342/m.204452 type:complete len:81 (+) Transcript_85342:593-835(+)
MVAMLQEALQSAAAVLMPRQIADAFGTGPQYFLNDELASSRPQCNNQALHNEVGMGTPHCLPDVPMEFFRDGLTLCIAAA